MSISFSEVPANARVPGVYIEIDNSLANSATQQQKLLVIGKGIESSLTAVETPTLCLNHDKAKALFGESAGITSMMAVLDKQAISLPIYAVTMGTDGMAGVLASLGDTQYHYIICSENDDTSIRALGEFLDARYKALQMIPGLTFIAKKGTHAELVTFGDVSNCPFISFMSVQSVCDAANAEMTEAQAIAAWGGQIAQSLSIDPCRPLQTLKLMGVYSNALSEFDWTERNLLLHEGMGTYTVSASGEVLIERPVTAYTTNPAGLDDDSYLDIMTPATAMYFREKQRSLILSKYGRHKLAKDGTRFAPGQAIVTPSIIHGELLALYRTLEYQGIVQDFDGYKASLIVEIDENNKSRVNYQDSPQFVNGLIITAGKIQFRK
ncbi:phage tail sheath subtilisin-like domain-containing protein [Vibrio sp. OPT18]|uniref:phage tail sheath subtilisin-like domain-containing protein n=1 Tax=Vibrio sp. OPT18 TaxID=2778641 RepID=UPI0018801D62|nr:phage tail sheath subtilisin-like domain-containing protein [Vibrio sp. OPT18]MBE8574460.1 phage tail sheath subtilisin-like domain-containing protein [Vibrio sp. OPT18]